MGKVVSIVLAGGKGKRMGADVSKQFIEINGKPIIYYTLKAFEECTEIDEIILVLPKDEIDYFQTRIESRFDFKISKIVEGGKERQDSVYNALNVLEDCDVVLIHDGARAFVSKKIIEDGIKYAKEFGAAAPGVMPKDTIKVKNLEGFSINTLDRSSLVAVQTPQCFKYDLIKKGHDKVKDEKIPVTDDTMIAELLGEKVYLFEGDYKNIKVTTPEDLILAENLVK
ncbi:2-C-methyl-D-erythritol 4-phosphate cytidylyltransferase [Clostridium sp. LIBA-8841]|uniref:2-C-methyl-D-erythritol 4-phosphate cytidylyltransferase n=1 Tax=Clostridium sp. LIBA-8841 TaxID=2987530 RepID=UPI002AC447FE|nr:2-C-methyl-D-erythritol 4-phosphate cytidylyltransferase [Clostridium sp. LIBA-8841]MDZ5254919.1 2-C-methyl-D-erythritol 4-phosphate cytidylyltransferase [Clostridium sp. LIBA-8841]